MMPFFNQHKSLPSIQWLVPFEAAARHLSFKLAAEELSVTPPAISQHVKALESHLEIRLFERKTRALVLTNAGLDFYLIAADILKSYREGCEQLLRQYQQHAFYVVTEPYIAHTLLIPNLMSFKETFDQMELRVETRLTMQGMSFEGVDAGIRFGNGNWSGVEALPLVDINMVPVGNPKYFKKIPARNLGDLKNHSFFYPKSKEASFDTLLNGLQQNGITLKETIPCESYLDAMTAAAEGLGITVAMLPYASRWIDEKKLVVPFKIEWNTEDKFWLTYRKGYSNASTMEAFYQWLKAITEKL